MPRLTIDNQAVEVPPGATILDAAEQAGVHIPTLCYLKGCTPQTSCFVCVVRVQGRENFLPSCATAVADGMIVDASSEDVLSARRTALELLLSDHLGDCIAPCQAICPAHLSIPQMVRALAAGDLAAAQTMSRDELVLPAVLGRICPAPCEKGCRRGAIDAAVAIRLSHRYAADAQNAVGAANVARKPATGKKVAIVGGGPVGLAAAFKILLAGHACTIVDQGDSLGGGLRQGPDAARLETGVLDADIAPLLAMGLQFRPTVRLGRDIKLVDLRGQFDAVVLAMGAVDKTAAELLGLPVGDQGIQVDHITRQTTVAGVFAASNAPAKQKLAVRAVGEGKALAYAVDQYLSARGVAGAPAKWTCRIGPLKEGEGQLFLAGADPATRGEPAEGNLSPKQVATEGRRCLHCDCRKADNCRLRDACAELSASPTRYKSQRRLFQQDATHKRVVYESGKCIACGLCVQITAAAGERLGLAFTGRGFNVRVGVPFDEGLLAALDKTADQVVAACPTGALALR